MRRDQYMTSATSNGDYRRCLSRAPELLAPLLQMARVGPLIILYEGADGPPDFLEILRDMILQQLQLEDAECRAEPSSPTCYLPNLDLSSKR